MTKYIQDSIRNNLRCIIRGLTRPQQKAISEVARGLFTAGEPILSHLAQDETKTAKKQSEKYSHHLGRINLMKKVNEFAFRKAKQMIRNTMIIAYDLTDISKGCAKKMEKLTKVWDGSERRVATGYTLHGIGINNILTRLEVHEGNENTQNQTRLRIIRETSERLDKKGIWVFDRGNDDKAFFNDLRHNLEVDFIARLKDIRQFADAKTGEIIKVKYTQPGKYDVYLMNRYNQKADTGAVYTLIISNHLEDKEPIRLLSSLGSDKYSEEQFVTMYLERWGVENIFKRIKTKFKLEKIRVLKHERLLNLIALIQFSVIVSTLVFGKLQQATNSLTTGVLMLYRRFTKLKSLTFNLDSFITYMKDSLEPLIIRNKPPPQQLSLFSRRQVVKLGII
jgi:hypothetical protein